MTDPRVLLIMVGVAFAYYGMIEVRHGASYLWHKTTHVVHRVVHPHDSPAEGPTEDTPDAP
jgi:hypothetical protein